MKRSPNPANTCSGKASIVHSCLAAKKDQTHSRSPTFPGVDLNYGAHAEAMAIGIALGGPKDNPLPPLPVEAVADQKIPTSSAPGWSTASSVEYNSSDPGVDSAKPKARRWHTLGGFFTKKTPSSPALPTLPSYKLQRSSLGNSHQDGKSFQRHAGPPCRTNSPRRIRSAEDTCGVRPGGPQKQHFPKGKVKGICTTDFGRANSAASPQVESVGPKPLPKDISSNNHHHHHHHNNNNNNNNNKNNKNDDKNDNSSKAPRKLIDAPPRIHVEIPNVEMERYSVMFGSLLNETNPLSLLARRNGQLGKLKTVGEWQEKVLCWTATIAIVEEADVDTLD